MDLNRTSVCTCTLTICILTLFLAASAQVPTSPAFNKITNPAGWSLPERGAVTQRGQFHRPGFPDGVTFTSYTAPKWFWMPWYFVENGNLILSQYRFYTARITRLEVKGKPFMFFAAVKGKDVGIATGTQWVDPDGRGSFTEFSAGSDLPALPDWALKRISTK